MITIKKFDNDPKIDKLYQKHLGKKIASNDIIYILYDAKKIVGYTVYKLHQHDVYLEWIYAPKYGKIFMKKLESEFKKIKCKSIFLNLSTDPTESIDTVMRRINFYIGLQYKVYNIKFRKRHGPLLYMKKSL